MNYTDTGVETLDATTGHQINNGATVAGNQILMGGLGASIAAGEGMRHSLVWGGTLFNPVASTFAYDVYVGLPADGESKIIALSLVDGVSDPNATGMQQNNMWIFALGKLEGVR